MKGDLMMGEAKRDGDTEDVGHEPGQWQRRPRWVTVSALIFAVIVLILLIVHVAGGGFGAELHGSGR